MRLSLAAPTSPRSALRPAFALSLLPWFVIVWLAATAHAQNQNLYNVNPGEEMRKSMKPQYRVGWDLSFAFGMSHQYANDPLLNVEIGTGEAYHHPEEAAESVPRSFQFVRERRKIPFILIEANMRPRFRKNLVPVMRVGELGLFTDAGVPADWRRAVAASVRQVVASLPGGQLAEGGVPATLGDEADLMRLLEQHDRERDAANARIRADNEAKLSADQRQLETGYAFKETLGRILGKRTFDTTYADTPIQPQNLYGTFQYFRRNAQAAVPKGRLAYVYAAPTGPKVSYEGFLPLVRIGSWGAWGSPESSAADQQSLAAASLAALQDEEFKEKAFLMGVTDFGGPEELKQLVANAPDVPVPAPKTAATPTAPAKPAAAAAGVPVAAPHVIDAHGPPLPSEPLARGGTGQGSGRPPPVIHDTKGGPQGWLPVSEEEKKKYAQDQTDFKKRMAAKQKRIEEMKKQKAREDAERFANNLKIFRAWANQKQEENAARDKMMIEKLKAAESRGDAVTAYIEKINGLPHIVLKNNTDMALYVEYTCTGSIDGVSIGESEGWTILPSGMSPEKDEVRGFWAANNNKQNCDAQIVKIRWWAREQDNKWRN